MVIIPGGSPAPVAVAQLLDVRHPAITVMKIHLLLLAVVAVSSSTCMAQDTNAFLVFEIDRYPYVEGQRGSSHEIKQAFKVPLTEEFISSFKRVSSQTSMGSEFYCYGGSLKGELGSTGFTWWIHRTHDGHWSTRMWGEGFEKIKGTSLNSMDPNVTQCVTIKKLEDLDMSYMISYVNKYDGINISFAAKYMTAKEVRAKGSIPTAPVERANRSYLFKGDIPTNCPMVFRCAFQE